MTDNSPRWQRKMDDSRGRSSAPPPSLARGGLFRVVASRRKRTRWPPNSGADETENASLFLQLDSFSALARSAMRHTSAFIGDKLALRLTSIEEILKELAS